MGRKRKFMVREYVGPDRQLVEADWHELTISTFEIGKEPMVKKCKNNQMVWDEVRRIKNEWMLEEKWLRKYRDVSKPKPEPIDDSVDSKEVIVFR